MFESGFEFILSQNLFKMQIFFVVIFNEKILSQKICRQ
jgi:hypothetical protein